MKRSIVLITLIISGFFAANSLFAEEILPGIDGNDKIPFDSKVIRGELDNGVDYYIRENSKPENRAELQIVFYAGAINEDEDQKGLAHFLEHMCFNGTKNFPKNELVSFLESTGMRFGADVNASTGFERTLYTITIPMDKEGMLDKGMQVLEDWAMNVTLDPEEIEKERGVIIEEWRTRKSAQERVQMEHLPFMLFNSRYTDRIPIGDTMIIKTAGREQFLRYYKDWYRPDLTAVIVVGDVDAKEIEQQIKTRFSKFEMPENPRLHQKYEVPMHDQILVSIAKDKELPVSNVSIMFKLPGYDPSTYAGYMQSVKDNLFSTMISQRLTELTQEADPPYLFAQAGLSEFLAGMRAFNGIAVTAPDGLEKGYKALLEEIFRVKQNGFNESELERAKEQTLNFYKKAFNEREKTESMAYTREYVQHFLDGTSSPGIEFEYDFVQKILPKITTEDMDVMIKEVVEEGSMVVNVSAQDAGQELPDEAFFLTAYYETMNSNLAAYEDVDTDRPLIANMPTPGKIVSEETIPEFNVTVLELSNGAEVYLKPTTYKDDQILFRAWSPGGTSLVDDNMYITASNAAEVVNSGGVADFEAITLDKMLAGKTVNLSPYISGLTEGFRGSTTPEDIESFLQVLHLYFTQPRKDPDAFSSYIKRSIDVIENSSKSPDAVLSDTLSAILGGWHPRSMPETAEDYKQIQLENAIKLYKERFENAGDFNFIFVGNFDVEEMKPLIESYIASLPGSKKSEEWKDVGIRTPEGVIKKEVKKGIEPKSTVRIVLSGDFEYNMDNYYALDAMTEVLSIRLREVIREDKGGVYGIGVFPSMQKYPEDTYKIYIYFTTNPGIVDDLITSVYDVIEEVKAGKFDKTYVEKVQEIQKREWEEGMERNQFWLSMIYESQFEDEEMMSQQKYLKYVNSLTVSDVQKSAKKYLNTDNLIQVVLNPED